MQDSAKSHSTDKNTDKKTQLYRHYDSAGRLLYVGISLSTVGRLSQHRQRAAWFEDITTITVEHFPSRDAALEAEALAIRDENPAHNTIKPFVPKSIPRRGGWVAYRDSPEYVGESYGVRFGVDSSDDALEAMRDDQIASEEYQRELWLDSLSERDADAYLEYWIHFLRYEGRAAA